MSDEAPATISASADQRSSEILNAEPTVSPGLQDLPKSDQQEPTFVRDELMEFIGSGYAPQELVEGDEQPERFPPDEIESILTDFRTWLQGAREIPPPAHVPVMDLATVVQQFTALRQDVNLQTKASRSQQEQTSQALDLLRDVQDVINQQHEQATAVEEGTEDELLRPLLKALIDAHDALSLALREVQRKLDQLPTAAPSPTTPTMPQPGAPPAMPKIEVQVPSWARWLGLQESIEQQLTPLRKWSEEIRAWQQSLPAIAPPLPDDSPPRIRALLEPLLVGYQMSRERIERTLRNQGLDTIPCVGLPFDPELMEVVEMVREPGRTETVVLEEVRPGYRWRGRLFRYAQVRVAKP